MAQEDEAQGAGGLAVPPDRPETPPADPAPARRSLQEIPLVAGDRPLALIPRTIEELLAFATFVVDGGMAPDRYFFKKGRAGAADVFYDRSTSIRMVATSIQHGGEIGLKPLQSVRNIAVINGTPSIFGDAGLALCISNPACEYVHEEEFGERGSDGYGWRCRAKRRGENYREVVRSFTVGEAKAAELMKNPVWKTYPQRMAMFRARSWALRDAFADVLMGMVLSDPASGELAEERDTMDARTVPSGGTAPAAEAPSADRMLAQAGPAALPAPNPAQEADTSRLRESPEAAPVEAPQAGGPKRSGLFGS